MSSWFWRSICRDRWISRRRGCRRQAMSRPFVTRNSWSRDRRSHRPDCAQLCGMGRHRQSGLTGRVAGHCQCRRCRGLCPRDRGAPDGDAARDLHLQCSGFRHPIDRRQRLFRPAPRHRRLRRRPNNLGPPVVPARDAAVRSGVVVNGLAIMLRPSGSASGPPLDRYYADCVIGGPGAFVLPVQRPRISPSPSARNWSWRSAASRQNPPSSRSSECRRAIA